MIGLADSAHVATSIPAESMGHARRFSLERSTTGNVWNPYPPAAVPAQFLEQLPPPAGITPSPLLASKQPHSIARAELPVGIEPGRF